MYELLIITKEWLHQSSSPKKFDDLTSIINKSYSKPMKKFGIIESPRISTPNEFLEDLRLTPGNDAFLVVLLGTKSHFDLIEKETGWKRHFDKDIRPLSGCYNSDIPNGHLSYFDSLSLRTIVKKTIATPGHDLDEDITDRVLASVGYNYHSERPSESARVYEVTAFTSFLRGMGTQLINYTLDNFLQDPNCQYLGANKVSKRIIRAVVIEEHLLVPYYEKLGFKLTGEKEKMSQKGFGEAGLRCSEDFHWTILEKQIEPCL